MNLPDKKLIEVNYKYEDGTDYFIAGDDLKNYQENMKATAFMAIRGHKFKPVNWNEKPKEDKV